MKRRILLLFILSISVVPLVAQVQVTNLLVENRQEPLGIDDPMPRLSWQLLADKRNVMQTAYEIRVSPDLKALKQGRKLSWHSGLVQSDQSVLVPYKGSELAPGTPYYWQVRVRDNKGKLSKWSDPSFFVTGLQQAANWQAQWIQVGFKEQKSRPSPLFRKEFTSDKKLVQALAFITAKGVYEAEINGQKVGDLCLAPGWTSYNKRLQYQTYDVTDLINEGNNAVGVTLGNGWYRGNIGFEGKVDAYGDELALLFQLELTYDDGSTAVVLSDGSWKSSTGPIVYSEIYHGETYDARLEQKGWSEAGFNDSGWSNVEVKNYSKTILVTTENEPIRKQEIFHPVEILETPEGDQVIDFGQNVVGWVQLKVAGKAGDKITITHTEVLDKDGNFYTESLRSARQQNTFILKGEGLEEFEPHFTWQGFRYIKVEGYPGELKPENFTATALYSDMELTGSFECSDDLVNQLQHNIQWGQRGNFLDVPTDCPQRDERLGWTGDAQAFARTASFNFRVHSFFDKWLKDVAADQYANGGVPYVVPDVLNNKQVSPGWADVATIAPWTMYLAYGDKELLETQYASMKAWVDYIKHVSHKDLWRPKHSFGDWLFYRPFDDNSGMSAVTDKSLIAQAFYAHSTQLLIQAAQVLGKQDDVKVYQDLLAQIKHAFTQEYMTPKGKLVSGTQTAYVLALHFDLLPEELRDQAAKRLVDNIRLYNTHLTTGFLGTPYLCHVLSRFGYTDVAYELLMQKTYPSWLYPVTMGATTIWERWDGIKPDGTFQTPGMNSFNHYAYGAIGDWLYRVVAGIDTEVDQPGYKAIRIQPQLGEPLTYAKAELKTYYGTVVSGWEKGVDKVTLQVSVPVNTKAIVAIPASDAAAITEGGKQFSEFKEITLVGQENGRVLVQIGSGDYLFEWPN
ncbi:family 78 glycoside hydrolase catalytic domain [Sunxiuqinia rutila]|uniref:family 78 glycoside hydrolase catalytic domain n=1 Tax=Sunxiuqinia rutila TaxID=1397841 RepID=UPI003D35F493